MRISDWSSDVCSSDLGRRGLDDQFLVIEQRIDRDRVTAAGNADDYQRLRPRRFGIVPIIVGKAEQVAEREQRQSSVAHSGDRGAAQSIDPHRTAGARGDDLPDRLTRHGATLGTRARSEEHTSELQSLMRISYAVFCLQTRTTSQP